MLKSILISITIVVSVWTGILGQVLPNGYSFQVIGDRLNPTAMTLDHHGRIWTAEKNGRILIYNEDYKLNSEPVVILPVDDFNERGLLGITLHPDFDDKPFLYVYYSVPDAGHNRLSRFLTRGDLVVPGSEEVLLDLDPVTGAIHNGGALLFDEGGYLYVGSGDGANPSNSQNPNNLLGKVLRIHEDGSIPIDNPFYNEFEGANRAIWAMGLRNPFNLAYDQSQDRIYVSDVGAGDYEEINRLRKGANYGWPAVEGPLQDQTVSFPEYEDPIFAYDHDEGCAIVGLAYYQNVTPIDTSLPSQILLFADYCDGYVKWIDPENPQEAHWFAEDLDRPLNIIVDEHHHSIYLQSREGIGGGSPEDNTKTNQGEIWKIQFTGNGAPQFVQHPLSSTVPTGESITLSVSALGTDSIEYRWYMESELIQIGSKNLILAFDSLVQDTTVIFATATNTEGTDTSMTALVIKTDNRRPVVTILNPTNGSFYQAGDTLSVTGIVQDEMDSIEISEYFWKADQHHDLHTHPLWELNGAQQGQFVVPRIGETSTNVWIRIYLSAPDGEGLLGTAYTELFPDLGTIAIQGYEDAKINIDGAIKALPTTLKSLKKLQRVIQVPEIQKVNNHLLLFNRWSDGSRALQRELFVEGDTLDLSIIFDTIVLGNGTGLYAEYFNDAEYDLDHIPDLIRIDSTVNFKWGNKSPHVLIDKDDFSVRWRGFIQPVFQDTYTLSFFSDDGVRVWIDDSLIVDQWVPRPPTENLVEISFQDTTQHKIQIEYFEKGGGAEMVFSWYSDHQPKEAVPKSQLFPMQFADIVGTAWVDIQQDQFFAAEDFPLVDATVLLLNERKDLVGHTRVDASGKFRFDQIEIGRYYIQFILNESESDALLAGPGLNEQFSSELISMNMAGEYIMDFTFHLSPVTSTNPIQEDHFKIFPNPCYQYLYMIGDQSVLVDQIEIYDLKGASILVKRVNSRIQHSKLDVDELTPGNYIICLKVNGQDEFHQFVKS